MLSAIYLFEYEYPLLVQRFEFMESSNMMASHLIHDAEPLLPFRVNPVRGGLEFALGQRFERFPRKHEHRVLVGYVNRWGG